MGTGEEPPARRENGRRRRRWTDGDDDDYDDEDFVAEEEDEEDCAEELSASSAGEEGEEDSDAEYQEDEEEEEEETPRPKRPVKGGARGRKGKTDPASNSRRRKRYRYEVDDDYEEEPSEDEEPHEDDEVEEYQDETPRPVNWGRKGKMDPAPVRARQRRYEVDDEYEEEPDEGDDPDEGEEPGEDEEVEEYHEEIEEEEEEEAPPRPKSRPECAGRGQNAELSRSHRSKYDEDDMDFEPELDEEEEEVDEDIDFDPEVDDDDEDEFGDKEEEEFSAARARKVTVKNSAKRKSVSKRRSQKKKKANKGSKSSKRKSGSAKTKKSASVRRVRKRFVVDDSDEDSEDDHDFIVDDHVEVDRHPRKKARTGTSKQMELEHRSFVDEGIWPNVESETSEFEFVTSDDEPDDAGTAVVKASTVTKCRKKRKSGSESSSDSEFIVSDKELDNLGQTESPKLPPVLATPIRKNPITRHGEDKGKEKKKQEEAGKPICGICLSEEQRTTVQGVLNCCSHYFCFACIMEWSRVESRCPLCKQRFTTITKSSKADLGLALRKAIIKVEERDQVYQPTEEEIRRWLDPYENVVCMECNQGGDDSLMLLCDICDSSAHTYCVGLGREVPEGNWYCGGCRLSDEGPSHARTPHTVGYERQSYRNHVDISPVGFGVSAQNGTFDRSSSVNRRRSFQGIDLNLSPREGPGEIHPAESQTSTDNVSTPSGRHATVSGRRQIHRYIRILLSRPRTANTRLEDMLPSFVPRNAGVSRTEVNHRSFHSSSEANTSQIPDGIQNQHNGLPFAPSMPLDGDDFPHIEGVKSNLRNM